MPLLQRPFPCMRKSHYTRSYCIDFTPLCSDISYESSAVIHFLRGFCRQILPNCFFVVCFALRVTVFRQCKCPPCSMRHLSASAFDVHFRHYFCLFCLLLVYGISSRIVVLATWKTEADLLWSVAMIVSLRGFLWSRRCFDVGSIGRRRVGPDSVACNGGGVCATATCCLISCVLIVLDVLMSVVLKYALLVS